MVVDDSHTSRTLQRNILEAANYVVLVAVDGVEALEIIADQGIPDLIVADILMPRMDGFELTRRIKGDETTAHVPVVLVTALESPEDRAKGIDAGCDAYSLKSTLEENELLEIIAHLI